jgi:hypothetical protein
VQIEGQLKRLLTQLKDLDEMKDELDEEEYNSSRQVNELIVTSSSSWPLGDRITISYSIN